MSLLPDNFEPRKNCPDCSSRDMTRPDADGWQFCNACMSDFAPDYDVGDDDDE